jgi:hypothetical protein
VGNSEDVFEPGATRPASLVAQPAPPLVTLCNSVLQILPNVSRHELRVFAPRSSTDLYNTSES